MQTELVLTYSFSFFGGDILFRIYYVKLSIGISRIITIVVRERFEMMRGLWRSMSVSVFSDFSGSFCSVQAILKQRDKRENHY